MRFAKHLIVAVLTIVVLASAWYLWSALFSPRETLPPDEKFEFQFGRGSGWHGLDLLRITSDGKSEYEYEEKPGEWRRKTFEIPEKILNALRDAINDSRVLDLDRHNIDRNIHDGEQWCLLIKEDGRSRSFYFSNKFPGPIRKLADFVDQTILEPFADPVDGAIVPARHHRKHEKEIWASIR